MKEIIIGGSLIAIASAPAFIHLWRMAQKRKEESLQKAKVVAKRRRYHK